MFLPNLFFLFVFQFVVISLFVASFNDCEENSYEIICVRLSQTEITHKKATENSGVQQCYKNLCNHFCLGARACAVCVSVAWALLLFNVPSAIMLASTFFAVVLLSILLNCFPFSFNFFSIKNCLYLFLLMSCFLFPSFAPIRLQLGR